MREQQSLLVTSATAWHPLSGGQNSLLVTSGTAWRRHSGGHSGRTALYQQQLNELLTSRFVYAQSNGVDKPVKVCKPINRQAASFRPGVCVCVCTCVCCTSLICCRAAAPWAMTGTVKTGVGTASVLKDCRGVGYTCSVILSCTCKLQGCLLNWVEHLQLCAAFRQPHFGTAGGGKLLSAPDSACDCNAS